MLDKKNFYINGKWILPSKVNDFEVINPSNEETCAIISLGNIDDVNLAVNSAKESFPRWSRVEKKYKISLLEKLYKIYESRWDEMTKSISLEMGAPLDWASSAQTTSGADHIKDFIERLKIFEFENAAGNYEVKGEKYGLNAIVDRFNIELGYVDDNKTGDGSFANVFYRIPFGVRVAESKKTNSLFEYVSVRNRLYEPVKRENKIRVVKINAANIVVSGF